MNLHKIRKTWNKRKTKYLIIGLIIFIFGLTMLSPVYFMIVNSLKRIDDFIENGGWAFPKKIVWENYKKVFNSGGTFKFSSMIINSVIFTLSSTFISIISSTLCAYVLARFSFRGKGLLVSLGVGSLFIPDLGSGSMTYKLLLDLGLMDTWGILIMYITPFGLNFLIMYSLFKTVAKDYSEAAALDGANEFIIFYKICMPMALGMMVAMGVIQAINAWNDYYTPYMYLPSLKTLSVGLQEMALSLSQIQKPMLFAGMVIGMTPVLILFICLNKTIISSVAVGGIKG